jgi:hypothetical protein
LPVEICQGQAVGKFEEEIRESRLFVVLSHNRLLDLC